MKIFAQIKEYWFLIVFVISATTGLVSLLMGQYVSGIALTTLKSDAAKVYVTQVIVEQLADRGIPDNATISAMDGTLKVHDSRIIDLTADQTLTKTQLQDVARILMQPPAR
ncbi:MAG: hypothetical protein E4G74_00250 [Erysipelotrichales bacterium]|jgi:hypothetical protein|nr:MAG: hypothetical protein E4G74_00250 [Erysipelotrichales bacterium]